MTAAVAALLVAGCAASEPEPGLSKTADPASPGSSASASAGPDGSGSPDNGATGLSSEEQQYVDEVSDPGAFIPAVLEGGREACSRMSRTARLDADSLVSALILEQVANGAAAIRHLCPELQEHLDRAETGFPDGTFSVGPTPVAGEQVAPGRYRPVGPTEQCTYAIRDGGGAVLDEGGAYLSGDLEMLIDDEADGVESSGCYAWIPVG